MNATTDPGPYFGMRRNVWADMTHAWKREVIEANHAEALMMNTARDSILAAQVEGAKAKCRDLIAQLDAYRPGRVSAMLNWIDGAGRDYWYVTLDGQDVGEIYYDSFGPVVKGDALSTLAYRAACAAEFKTERA